MESQGIMAALRHSYTGVSSQMKRLEVISENIANAEALPDEQGKLYQRKVAIPRNGRPGTVADFGDRMALSLKRSSDMHMQPGGSAQAGGNSAFTGTDPYEVIEVEGEKIIHDPSHPRADEKGYVRMPNVNVIDEMVDLMSSNRSYEANITVMSASKSMAKRILEI